ncbi:MAG: beta-ketoacyl-ACP synthase II [Nannocystaceae bacterium]
MSSRRVVVTGTGVISPLGVGSEATWSSLRAGKSGIGEITQFDTTDFPTKIAGEVRDFDPSPWFTKRQLRQMDRFIRFAVGAAAMACEQAGIGEGSVDPERFGVYVGAGMGGLTMIEETVLGIDEKGPRRAVSPYFVPAIIINLAPGQIAIRHGCKGPNLSHVSACSTGAHSIGEASRVIERGDADIMIAGGTESVVTKAAVGGFCAARALSKNNAAPEQASRPFDRDRDGFVLSEGAGLLVLEELEHARARGATILAEVAGYGLNCDAHHITSPSVGGEGASRCMNLALKDAGIRPEAVGYLNAHGTSTVADTIETRAIKNVFGKHAHNGLAVSSTKSMHGHLLGAAGGLEAAICVMALRHGILPPTINLDNPDDECDLDYVPHTSRVAQVEYAMSNSFGFGGTNATLVFRSAP